MAIIWNVTVDATEGTAKYETIDSSLEAPDLTKVFIGDYANIFGEAFDAANRGSFPIINVVVDKDGSDIVQYFVVSNLTAIEQLSVSAETTDIVFFRPKKFNIYSDSNRPVIISQSSPNRLDIVLPATAQSVSRTENEAAYLQPVVSLDVSSLERQEDGTTTIVTAEAHGLDVGDHVILDNAFSSLTAPIIHAGTVGVTDGTTSGSLASIWSNIAHTPAARYNHTFTKLPDVNSAIVIGGFDGSTYYSNAKLLTVSALSPFSDGSIQKAYDWGSTLTGLTEARQLHTANALIDNYYKGEVLVVGGHNAVSGVLKSVRRYDALNDAVENTGDMTWTRAYHTATVLEDGTVIVAAGASSIATLTKTSELYDPTTDSFSVVGNLTTQRMGAEAVLLANGQVMVVGGRTGTLASTPPGSVPGVFGLNDGNTTSLNSCEIYDPDAQTWLVTGAMSHSRSAHRAIVLPDGQVIVIGGTGIKVGQGTSESVLDTAELYNPNSGRWRPAGKMRIARRDFIAELQPSANKILVSGGKDADDNVLTSSEYYDIATGKWTFCIAEISTAIYGAKSCVFDDDVVCHAMGHDATAATAVSDLFLPGSNVYSAGILNGILTVESASDDTTFTTTTGTGYSANASSDATITLVKATEGVFNGPFIWDTEQGCSVTSVETVLSDDLALGKQYRTVNVADGSQFPDEAGWLCFAFGFENATFPVPYLGKLSDNVLILDYTYVFPNDISSGSIVTLLYSKSLFIPDSPETAGSFYLTASSAGRIAASDAIDAAVAAGFDVNKTVSYPGDKGLGAEGFPTTGTKLSDKVMVFGGDDLDSELETAREE